MRAQQHPPRSHAIHSRVRSFSRAGGRLRAGQAALLAEHGPDLVLEVPRHDAVRTVDPTWRLDVGETFGHGRRETAARPLLVEIGPGSGEALLAHAAAHPHVDHLAVEVWETAIARMVSSIVREGLANVRVVPADASQLLATALPEASVEELWTFFPDPWRKPRHRKRRLVEPGFARTVARVLVPGGTWRLATDWADYAWQMRDTLEAAAGQGLFTLPDAGARPALGARTWVEGDLGNGVDPGSPSGTLGGWSERFEGRVPTRFEQRGIEAGRTVRDLTAVRTHRPWDSGPTSPAGR